MFPHGRRETKDGDEGSRTGDRWRQDRQIDSNSKGAEGRARTEHGRWGGGEDEEEDEREEEDGDQEHTVLG